MPWRNYEKVSRRLGSVREGGESTALEEIARRAGVGIGTRYRDFPNRQALLEAVYVNEVEEVSRWRPNLHGRAIMGGAKRMVRALIGDLATKQALAGESLNYLYRDGELFQVRRTSLYDAGVRCSSAPRKPALFARTSSSPRRRRW